MQNNYAYLQIKKYIEDHTGIVYYKDKDKDLSRKLEKRMQASGIGDCHAYWQLLADKEKGAKEFDSLVNALTIGETYFFRDKATFDGLREIVLPAVIEKNRDSRTIRIWSAGCASGEEAYSLSILIKREFSHLVAGWDITILGTDINRDFIASAIDAKYGDWSFRETHEDIKQSCFTRHGRTWQLNPQYKNGIAFEYHNMVKNPFPSLVHNLVAFDIVLCRNVIIYFNEETTRKLIKQFKHTLVEGGWLVVGHADHNIRYFSDFKTINFPGAFFYRKVPEDEMEEGKILPEKAVMPQTTVFNEPVPVQPLPPVQPLNRVQPAQQRQQQKKTITRSTAHEFKELCKLTNRGWWEQALALSGLLLEKDNLNPLVYFYQALIREQTGQVEEAEKALRKSLYLDRNFVPGHYHLGLLLQNNRNIKGAKKSFENVIHLLEKYDANYKFEIADDISASQLKELTEFHLEVLQKAGMLHAPAAQKDLFHDI